VRLSSKYKNFHARHRFRRFPFVPSLVKQDWERFHIGLNGCSALFPDEPEWESSYSVDSSFIRTGEAVENKIFYGVICISSSSHLTLKMQKKTLSRLPKIILISCGENLTSHRIPAMTPVSNWNQMLKQ
jgi:hypothetical protein